MGQIIKKYRKKKNLTHSELAELVGLSRPSIIRLESGKKKIYFHELGKLLGAVDLTFSQLESELSNVDLKVKIENQPISKQDQITLLKILDDLI